MKSQFSDQHLIILSIQICVISTIQWTDGALQDVSDWITHSTRPAVNIPAEHAQEAAGPLRQAVREPVHPSQLEFTCWSSLNWMTSPP